MMPLQKHIVLLAPSPPAMNRGEIWMSLSAVSPRILLIEVNMTLYELDEAVLYAQIELELDLFCAEMTMEDMWFTLVR